MKIMCTKFKFAAAYLFAALLVINFSSCTVESTGERGPIGPAGPAGIDGNANVYSSGWITPTAWGGKSGDWYFDVANANISKDVVEGGVVLAYVSLPGDVYDAAVRQLPAYVLGCNWDYLIPNYGTIEFLCDAINAPGTAGYNFRFVIIPANYYAVSTEGKFVSVSDIKDMTYKEACQTLNIPIQ
jgi:hypothetical protein